MEAKYIKGIDKVDPNDLLYDTMIDVDIAYIIADNFSLF